VVETWQTPLAATDVILRSCRKDPLERLLASIRAHHESDRPRYSYHSNEWGLSVAAVPGADDADVLRRATQLRQSHYRVGTVSYFRDLGCQVVHERQAHGLILFPAMLDIEDAAWIAATFGEPRENPYYQEGVRASLVGDKRVGFYVDVNSASEDGKVGTTLLAALDGFNVERRGLHIGAAVRAIDADDNVCAAMVVDRRGMWLGLQLNESTWQPLPSAP
jgi:hypothetical protein